MSRRPVDERAAVGDRGPGPPIAPPFVAVAPGLLVGGDAPTRGRQEESKDRIKRCAECRDRARSSLGGRRSRCRCRADAPTLGRPTVSRAPCRRHRHRRPRRRPIAARRRRDAAGLGRCRVVVERHAGYLTRLDAVLGDGDHGDNLVDRLPGRRGRCSPSCPPDTPPGELLRAVGHRLVAAVGGASGPLYGTAFLEAGFARRRRDDPGRRDARPRCSPPRRTAWPAAAAARSATRRSSTRSARRREPSRERRRDGAAPGGRHGATRFEPRRAGCGSTRPSSPDAAWRCGSASGSIGHLDPGAVSCLLLLRALGGCVNAATSTGSRTAAPGPDRGARARASARLRRRPTRGRCAFAQYQLSQLIASGGTAGRSRPRPWSLELVRLADADGGALWLGGAGRARRSRSLGDRRRHATATLSRPSSRTSTTAARLDRRATRRAEPSCSRRRRRCDRCSRSGRQPGRDARRRTASGSRSARPPRARRRVPGRPAARGARARAPGARRRSSTARPTSSSRSTRTAASFASTRPASGCSGSTAEARSGGPAARSSAARSPAVTAARTARSPRSRATGEPDRLPRDGGPRRYRGTRSGSPAATPRRRDGRRRRAGARATAILRDISAVQALEELREGFVATVSHELRTPLALIRGYAETLLHLELDADAAARLRRADRRGDRPAGRARRPDPRRDPPPGRPADPRARADDLRLARRPAARRPAMSRRRRSPRRRRCRPTCRRSRSTSAAIGQVLANLVGNALKYAPDGQPGRRRGRGRRATGWR